MARFDGGFSDGLDEAAAKLAAFTETLGDALTIQDQINRASAGSGGTVGGGSGSGKGSGGGSGGGIIGQLAKATGLAAVASVASSTIGALRSGASIDSGIRAGLVIGAAGLGFDNERVDAIGSAGDRTKSFFAGAVAAGAEPTDDQISLVRDQFTKEENRLQAFNTKIDRQTTNTLAEPLTGEQNKKISGAAEFALGLAGVDGRTLGSEVVENVLEEIRDLLRTMGGGGRY